MALLYDVTQTVEEVSIDEAYLDLTGQVEEWAEAVVLARRLQKRVRDGVGLSASLGVATNKLVLTDVVYPRWPRTATSPAV